MRKNKLIIIVAVVILLLAAGFTAVGAYASGRTLSLPGISVNGINVGECTKEQIKEKLSALTTDEFGYKPLHISFSGDVGMDIAPQDAGVDNLYDQLSEKIYAFGRDGGIFKNGFAFIKHTLSDEELMTGELFEPSEESLKPLVVNGVNNAMHEINEPYKIENDTLILIKGAKTVHINADNVYKMVVNAYGAMNFEPIEYDSEATSSNEADLDAIYGELHAVMVEATYDKQTGAITDDTVGVDFDLAAAKNKYNAASDGERVEIPLTITNPKMSAEVLRTRLFNEVLSEKSTPLTGTANRVNNIKLAAKAVNGTILMPGEEFSFNGTVGKRTTAKGYKEAGAYIGGETVQQVGGGICQVSSTIYCCTLLANLKVTDRDEHMFPVSYLPYGMDATVSWGSLDYKFVNTANYPIKISAYTKDGYLTVKFLGVNEMDGHYYKLSYKQIGTSAKKTEYKEDPSLAPGETKVERKGFDGVTVESYRTEYDANGNKLKTEYIAKSSYRSQSQIILQGPEKTTPDDPTPTDDPVPTDDPTPSDEPIPTDVTENAA